jgi:hypothetical protein
MKEGARTTQELSNVEIVILSAYVLGGDQVPVDTEDVAMKANELAPGRFTWRKYPEQVDLEPVRKRLSDALSSEHGGLLAGGVTRGWYLTPAGVAWASQNIHRAASGSASRERVDRDLKRRRRNEQVRMKDLSAWAKFATGQDVSRREAEAVFRVSEYVRGFRRQQLIDRGRTLFQEDKELGPFVEAMAEIATMEREERSWANS